MQTPYIQITYIITLNIIENSIADYLINSAATLTLTSETSPYLLRQLLTKTLRSLHLHLSKPLPDLWDLSASSFNATASWAAPLSYKRPLQSKGIIYTKSVKCIEKSS